MELYEVIGKTGVSRGPALGESTRGSSQDVLCGRNVAQFHHQ